MTEELLLENMEMLKKRAVSGVETREKRFKEIESLIDAYYVENDELPPRYLLEKFSSLCLLEELSNQNSYKMKHENFPILTEHQHMRRMKREKVYQNIEFRNAPITGSRTVSYVSEDNIHTKGKHVFYIE